MSISVLEGLFKREKSTITIVNPHLDVHPDIHLDVQFIMVIVLGLSLTKFRDEDSPPKIEGVVLKKHPWQPIQDLLRGWEFTPLIKDAWGSTKTL